MSVSLFSRWMLNGIAGHPAILMYHGTPARGPAGRWDLPLSRFVQHLKLFAEAGWQILSVRDLPLGSPPPKSLVVTFDDGYADNMAACEMLARHGMRATWFLVSGRLGQCADWRGAGGGRLMDEAMVRDLLEAGMEVGSHTRSHASLDEITSARRLEEEISGSRKELEDLTGQKVTSFAYPYGRLNKATVAAVRSAGYRLACSCRGGLVSPQADPLLLPRLEVDGACGAGRLARMLWLGAAPGSWGQLTSYYWQRLGARLR